MRLTCPNCSARYEVDDSLVPPEGRDVQCSNCMTTWFQPAHRNQVEEAAPEPAPLPDDNSAPVGQPDAPVRREIDPALRDILREEREREEQLRRAANPVEEQSEMALDDPAPEVPPAPEPEDDEEDALSALRAATAQGTAIADARTEPHGRDLLPDIEEINSTLRATTDRDASDGDTSDIDSMDRRPRRRRGFRVGFLLALILAGAAIGTYAYAPLIAENVPQLTPYLQSYVNEVDGLRVWLHGIVGNLAAQLSSMTGNEG